MQFQNILLLPDNLTREKEINVQEYSQHLSKTDLLSITFFPLQILFLTFQNLANNAASKENQHLCLLKET